MPRIWAFFILLLSLPAWGQEPVFQPRSFAEVLAYGELPPSPEDSFSGGVLYQVEFYRDQTPTKRLFWASCGFDGKNGAPFAYSDGGERLYMPWVSCTFIPESKQIGHGQPSDMTNSTRHLTAFYDRNVWGGMKNDVKVYALGYRRGKYFQASERVQFFGLFAANLLGARFMQFTDDVGGGADAAIQPFAANPEGGLIWNVNQKTTLTFSAFGAQGHWGVGPAQEIFDGNARDLMYYTKARLDVGNKLSIAVEYDWYRFNGQGLSNFNAFIVGAKVFTTNWFRRR